MPSLFIPVAAMGKCKQIKNGLWYVSDVSYCLFIRESMQFWRHYATYLKCFLMGMWQCMLMTILSTACPMYSQELKKLPGMLSY